MGMINLDRGVMQRFHARGMKISMYLDDPGTYLTETGEPIPAELAAEAGFDTDKYKREKIKQTKVAAFKAQLEREMAVEEDAIAQAISGSGKVDVRHIGGGQYAIFSAAGERMTKVAMSRADAELITGTLPAAEVDPATTPSVVAK